MAEPRPILLDLRDLGINTKGVARVLGELAPRLVAMDHGRYHVATTPSGLALLPPLPRRQVHCHAAHAQTLWEQVSLPNLGRRIGAGAIYSHRECGALWGPALLLHVTEDPEIRWARETAPGLRDRARRAYSRVLLDRSLQRASVVVSTRVTAELLERNHRLPRARTVVVPLAVDHAVFHPAAPRRGEDPYFFHLSSADPRDNTEDVIKAMGAVTAARGYVARLVIGGGLGDRQHALTRMAAEYGLDRVVEFTGRVPDPVLATLYGESLATINASADEGFGLQPLEALACATLLISVPSPAVEEVVDGAVAIVAGPGPVELALAMTRALDEPDLRYRAALSNPIVAQRFSWDASAGRLHELLTRLAE